MDPLSLPGTPTTADEARNGQEPKPGNGPQSGSKSGTRYGLVELERSGQAPAATKELVARAEPRLPGADEEPSAEPPRAPLALLCFEAPDSPVGRYVTRLVEALSKRRLDVHLFTRLPFAIDRTGVTVHTVGPDKTSSDLEAGVEDFTLLCAEAFNKQFPNDKTAPALLGLEWSTLPALQMLSQHTGRDYVVSLSSLERQRSDMSSELSKRIDAIETSGLRDAGVILCQDTPACHAGMTVGEQVRLRLPECSGRLVNAVKPFPVECFRGVTDPGQIKARYQIGPIDPTILYLGDLDERHGPDALMKSVPAILKNHPQARFVFVGDGDLLWPLRVYARYLGLEGVVRLAGHVEGQALAELFQAADVVVVPSRQPTEWWPVQAAWAARKPVVAAHGLACPRLIHERNAVLVYPHESSVVWGVERVLYDAKLRDVLVHNGEDSLEEHFGWNSVAAQLEELLRSKQPA